MRLLNSFNGWRMEGGFLFWQRLGEMWRRKEGEDDDLI